MAVRKKKMRVNKTKQKYVFLRGSAGTSTPTHRHIGSLTYRHIDIPAHQQTGTSTYRHIDIQFSMRRRITTRECVCPLVCWSVGPFVGPLVLWSFFNNNAAFQCIFYSRHFFPFYLWMLFVSIEVYY